MRIRKNLLHYGIHSLIPRGHVPSGMNTKARGRLIVRAVATENGAKKRVAEATLEVMMLVMPLSDVVLSYFSTVSTPSIPRQQDSREEAGRSWC